MHMKDAHEREWMMPSRRRTGIGLAAAALGLVAVANPAGAQNTPTTDPGTPAPPTTVHVWREHWDRLRAAVDVDPEDLEPWLRAHVGPG
ncbi:MAG: hypothetical protein ACOYOQ_10405 [Microthrixaceae bacterium]